jgi:hypothetical protein
MTKITPLQKYLKIKLKSSIHPFRNTEMFFKLDNTDIANRYQLNIQHAINELAKPCHVSWGMYASKKFFPHIQKSINKSIAFFNKKNPLGKVIEQQVEDNTSHEQLNFIHSKFEEYANLFLDVNMQKSNVSMKQSIKNKITFHLNNINNCVHTLESVIGINSTSDYVSGWLTFSVCKENGYTFNEKLKEDDFDLFTMGSQFGWLFLGYATTGKSLYHIMKDDNLDLLQAGAMASPQVSFSTNTLALFGSMSKQHQTEMELFNNWWDENNISELGYQKNDKHNSIGYIKIGEFVPTEKLKNKTEKEIVDFYTEFSKVNDVSLTSIIK